MSVSVSIAVANMVVTHDVVANLAAMQQLAESAAAQGAQLLVLPEVALQGYLDFALDLDSAEGRAQADYVRRTAEPLDGPSVRAMVDVAAEHDLVIQLGMAEAGEDGLVFNTAVVVDDSGVLGRHRKVHNQFEAPYYAEGAGFEPVATKVGVLGPAICYDMAFPETGRAHALRGAQILTLSTAWPMAGHERATDYYGLTMDLVCQAGAFFNQVVVACANHCESGAYSQGLSYYGGSQVVGRDGCVISGLATEPGVLVVSSVEVEQPTGTRPRFFGHDLLSDRRPETYGS
jgi:predicted amidohydrolase